jgi:hypothetical protein
LGYPWFFRGGALLRGVGASVFAFDNDYGSSWSYVSFRNDYTMVSFGSK